MAEDKLHQPSLQEVIEASSVDPNDEPSVGWGWHGHANKFIKAVGVFFAAFLLFMLIGNHESRIEDIYLVVAAVIILGLVANDSYKKRNKWHR